MLSLESAYHNIACDEVLFQSVLQGKRRSLLRVWQSFSPCVVLGMTSRVKEQVIISACRNGQIPVIRRFTGGGVVLLGKGSINYTLILTPAVGTIREGFQHVLGMIAAAFSVQGILLEQQGISDLTLNNRKVSGNAQRRTRDCLLVHGTLLAETFDCSSVARYLYEPLEWPAYRQHRVHEAFLYTLPLSEAATAQGIEAAFAAYHQVATLDKTEQEAIAALVVSKYQTDQWNFKF